MSACGYLADDPDAHDDDAIRDEMSGNLCRCTGYAGILAAVKQAAQVLRDSGADPRERHALPDGGHDGGHDVGHDVGPDPHAEVESCAEGRA
jgi:hypothetical protein